MSKEQEQLKICEYLFRRLEKMLTPAEENDLKEYLENNPDGLDLYIGVANLYAQLSTPNRLNLREKETDADMSAVYMNLLKELGDDEKHAEVIDIPKETPDSQLIETVSYPARAKRKLSKFSIVSGIMSIAAIVFLVIFIRFAPPKSGIEVATLKDSINTKWADVSLQKGARLLSDGVPLMLREGFAKLEFDNNACVVVEAPAEFQILAEDRIGLRYGKVYATVPTEAIGFSVYTPNAKVVDMGTEFGVHAESHGGTRLHVLKGKTVLMAGDKGNKIGIEVSKGKAKKISGAKNTITDIPCDENLFVRAFDSKTNVIWRQQPSLDLADIVRGGNGLGTGNSEVRLNPIKGFTTEQHKGFATAKKYRIIPKLPFVDGIFVPDGHFEQVISSRGDVFTDCPATSGIFDFDLIGNPEPGLLRTNLREGTVRFNGQMYAQGGKPCIIMHTNLGVTFDLDALRYKYQKKVNRFTSKIGIADLKEDCSFNADLWVLVDGEVRYSLQQYKQKGVLNDVSVEIKEGDRFLTLVTTDGGDPDDPGHFYTRAISCDWCVFTEPVLVLE